MAIVKTIKQLAQACDRAQRTVEKWKQEPGFPMLPVGSEGGRYDSEAVLAWRRNRDIQVQRDARQAEDYENDRVLKRERIRALQIKNDEAEVDVLKRQGKLWDCEVVIALMKAYAGNVEASLEKLRKRGDEAGAKIIEDGLLRAKKQGNAIIDRAIRESQK
jgi:hypothetical protein